MLNGYLGLVLHAHLPFVRHPEYQRFLEEDWLFEGISETYLPLLRMFHRLKKDGVPFRLTISVSPTLSAMLTDDLLQNRYIHHLRRLIELGEKELERTRNEPEVNALARMYKEFFEQNLRDFVDLYRKNILWGFRALEKEGYLEIITTAGSHPFLPLMSNFPEAIEAQVTAGVISHGRTFGTGVKGFWLPECGYFPGLEVYLKNSEIRYFFTAAHAVLFSDQKLKYGVYAPLQCPNGVVAFGRDNTASQAVWSQEHGYPGDAVYREFYRDIGYDLPLSYIGPYIHEPEVRVCTGYKYWAVTGKTDRKKVYDPGAALRKAEEHAENFLYNRIKLLKKFDGIIDRNPFFVVPFDAELFGHWWFEGIHWLESLFRKIAEKGELLTAITPTDYLKRYPENQVGTPAFSSWGNKGYAEVWLDGKNDWIYRHIHKACDRMCELVGRFPNESGLKGRVLNQAAREVILSMASDWPFIMKTGTTVPYAEKRIREHLHNFNKIYDNLCRNTVDTEWLTTVEKKNNVFPDIDYRIFRKKSR